MSQDLQVEEYEYGEEELSEEPDGTKYSHPLLRPKYNFEKNYDNDISVETGGHEVIYNIKVFKFPANSQTELSLIRIEMTKEDDIFYVLKCEIDRSIYETLKQGKGIKSSFDDFLINFSKILDSVRTNRTVFTASLDQGSLSIKQKLNFKKVEILALPFEQLLGEDEYTVSLAQFRFNEKQAHFLEAQSAHQNLLKLVAENNKQLYNQLKRGQEFNATRTLK